MKLLKRIKGIYIMSIGTTLLVMLALVFFILKAVIEEELDEQLSQKASIASQMIKNGILPNDPFTWAEVLPTGTAQQQIFSDTLIYNSEERENELYRKLETTAHVGQKVYKITVVGSEIEWRELMLVLTGIFLLAMMLSVMASYWLNKRLSRKIWAPFFQNLDLLKGFSLKRPLAQKLANSNIDEFQELQQALTMLIDKVSNDYNMLKTFAENVSHEFQTPISIILAKLEALMQSQQLTETEAEKLEAIRHAATRISRLTRDILLLSKIENQQFVLEPDADLAIVLAQQIGLLRELFESKHLALQTSMPEHLPLSANSGLLEKMFSNLLSNAFKHNVDGGWIKIYLDTRELVLENSGDDPGVPAHELFHRFKKGLESSASSGLGLAIVREIVAFHGWQIDYQYQEGVHIIKVCFQP